MNRTVKLLLGIITLWPAAYMVLFFVFIFSAILFRSGAGGSGPGIMFGLIFVLHLFTMLVIAGLTVFYIVNVFRNDRVDKDKKALWAIVLFMGNVVAMPIYWYLFIWKAPEALTSTPGLLGSVNTAAWTNDVNNSRTSDREQYVPPAQPPNWRD